MQRRPRLGPQRFFLPLALLIPLALVLVILAQVSGVGLAAPTTVVPASDADASLIRRPQSSRADPPPTLAPPTATPRATATPAPTTAPTAPPEPTPPPEKNRHYTVQSGDELKYIAANYDLSIWQIIDSNTIPNPDSLRVGQVLSIPDD
jgi:LysM repeat protein